MYICICNAVTDKQVNDAIENGATSLDDLKTQLGVATCCGSCAKTVDEMIQTHHMNQENRKLVACLEYL
ncbi:(2Fe-2S)-binding protein [Basilea psittacipulmonis]|uniref:(2Fe-2S)-binding protein n=1 Tax=Basilea psittacipulmonis TaxID=1472345 RepID=UPI0006911202|nr:(2Fe-2S)-binding protein [Basilea psittacipulmonis]